MSNKEDTNKKEAAETETKSETNTETTYTEVELDAIDQGWNPDFDGPNKRTAEEFLERGSFFRKIESQNAITKELQKQVKFLVDRNKQAEKLGHDRALADLKAQKKEALANDDHDAVVEIDEQMHEIKEQVKELKTSTPEVAQGEVAEEFIEWRAKNKWYVNDPEAHDVADAIGVRYAKANPDLQAKEVYKYVTTQIKKRFPEHFDEDSSRRSPTVERGNRTTRNVAAKPGKYSVKDLDDTERAIVKNMVQQGHVKSEEEYVKQLEASGYFK